MEAVLNQWWAYIILGIVAGIFSGMLGIGGGVIMVPGLVLIFHFLQKSAQGTALAVMVPMVLIGAIRYYLNPEIKINISYIGLIAVGAVVGAFLGTHLAYYFSENILRKLFAVLLIVIGFKMLLTSSNSLKKSINTNLPADQAVELNHVQEKNNVRK